MKSIQHITDARRIVEALVERATYIYSASEGRYFAEIFIPQGKKTDSRRRECTIDDVFDEIFKEVRIPPRHECGIGGYVVLAGKPPYRQGIGLASQISGKQVLAVQPLLPNVDSHSIAHANGFDWNTTQERVEKDKKYQGNYVFDAAQYRH
ncbi:MAG: hypothetical protein AABW64_02420 [Nanoarchaeota archaeon]